MVITDRYTTNLYSVSLHKLFMSIVFNFMGFYLIFSATNKSQKGNQRDDRALVQYDDLFS